MKPTLPGVLLSIATQRAINTYMHMLPFVHVPLVWWSSIE